MVYGPDFLNISRDDVFHLHCELKGDEPTFRLSKEGESLMFFLRKKNRTIDIYYSV